MMRKKTQAVLMFLLVLGFSPSLLAQSTNPVQYYYDDAGRLIRVVDQNGNVATYNYDAVGNLVSISRSSLPGNNGLAIISFSPQQGPVGTVVTIQGQGFSTTPADDSVQFNGTPASVTGATATSLTVISPTGATTGLISVTASGSTVANDTDDASETLSSRRSAELTLFFAPV